MHYEKVIHVDYYSLPENITELIDKEVEKYEWHDTRDIPLDWFNHITEVFNYILGNFPDSESSNISIDWRM